MFVIQVLGESLHAAPPTAEIILRCIKMVYERVCAMTRFLSVASRLAGLQEDIRDLCLFSLNEESTALCHQIGNLMELFKLAPTQISLIDHFEPIREEVIQMPLNFDALPSPAVQQTVKRM
jgi:hypothetical protein